MNQKWNIEEFAAWWMKDKPFKSPMRDSIKSYDNGNGVTLFRDGQFQVQLWIGDPRTEIPPHFHPNVETVEVHVAGFINYKTAQHKQHDGQCTISAGEVHGGRAGRTGGCFISIQKWLNGIVPTSIEDDWVGAPINDQHAAVIGGDA